MALHTISNNSKQQKDGPAPVGHESPAQQMRAARALIEDEAHWTQGVPARDDEGQPVSWDAGEAVCFCATCALARATGSGQMVRSDAYEFLRRAASVELLNLPEIYNDTHSHAEVLAMYDRAIALAEGAHV